MMYWSYLRTRRTGQSTVVVIVREGNVNGLGGRGELFCRFESSSLVWKFCFCKGMATKMVLEGGEGGLFCRLQG